MSRCIYSGTVYCTANFVACFVPYRLPNRQAYYGGHGDIKLTSLSCQQSCSHNC